jgi:DNA polymerase-4
MFAADRARRCIACASPRLVVHAELTDLHIAHVDCDAFYAAVEKRDDPTLAERPVIVGGGRRGVVAAACYVARRSGVRSAMPMFMARKLCPEAVVIAPDMRKYAAAGKQVLDILRSFTPAVEPLSIDEAFIDLAGTERLHRCTAAQSLARAARRIESEIGVTASVGLSYCKFLAKIASDLDKPRGFAIIGRQEAPRFLADQPVRIIWGVGEKFSETLRRDGITHVADLLRRSESELVARYGVIGQRLWCFAQGEDTRTVEPARETKGISSETTFDSDERTFAALRTALWTLCENVSQRLKESALSARTVTLKLKTADFQIRTRSHTLASPTQLADTVFRCGEKLLERCTDGTRYRLIGIAVTNLGPASGAGVPDLLDSAANRSERIERTIDRLRAKMGANSIGTGRSWKR